MTDPASPREDQKTGLPPAFMVWLFGTLISFLGNSMFNFALGWHAAAYGGTIAGLVFTAVSLPRATLLLVGGAVSDRVGARRIMIAGDATMTVAALAIAIVAYLAGTPPWLLIAAALVGGTVDAFYLPGSGSMPRRLVGKQQLTRALALRQIGTQTVVMGGGPLGGILVGLVGLAGVALINSFTFVVVLVILILIRPRYDAPPVDSGRSVLHDAFDGVRFAFRDSLLRPSLLLVGAAAGFLLPVMPLLVPLLVREQDWSIVTAGLIVGAQGVGMVSVLVPVAKRGPLGPPGLLSGLGLVAAGIGVLGIALAPTSWVAIAAALLVGIGNGVFTSHIGPLILTAVPVNYLARVQSLLSLVQSLPLLFMNNVLGNIAEFSTTAIALVCCATAAAATGIFALFSPSLRRARMG